jgi:hypothetical protein
MGFVFRIRHFELLSIDVLINEVGVIFISWSGAVFLKGFDLELVCLLSYASPVHFGEHVAFSLFYLWGFEL